MKEHILDKHEAGREYVVCPLPHCGFPVRDLPAHFRVNHAGLKMPKFPQTRAMIWRDFNERGERKLTTRKPKFREGHYTSTKMGKSFYYRSGYECTVYECLDQDNDVVGFAYESLEIPYMFKGKPKKYIPDLIIKYTNGTTKMVEIKPSSQTLLEQNQCKWNSAAIFCKDRGWEFEVWTEKGIDNLKQKVKSQKIIFG